MSPHLPPSLLQMLRPTSPECIDKSTSDRHFVTWTDQEDDILRQAVTTYGVDKWSIIAAQFSNKTSRQCRRRWHTYLVTDCKKGGWSPEEDQLLLEAHRRFGNRWTEIAKMVPGRTDNAVKNRFSALGKKQAKKSSVCDNNGADTKNVSKRKALELNSSVINKRSRGDYSSYLSCNHNLQQQKQHQFQAKQSLQTWTVDQSMADRAHPVHNEKIRKDFPLPTTNRTPQDFKIIQNKKVPKCASVLPVSKSSSNEGLCLGTMQTPQSFSENVSPPRLAALAQNAALLDSLVERRDARLKLWGTIDDTWKSFDWFTMEDSGKILQPANFTCKNVPLGDMRTSLYKGKENYIGYSQISCESQIPSAVPMSQESVNQHKNVHELGTATPTIQHERAWKVRSTLEGLDCSSPSDEMNLQADASTPLQSDCYSSFPVDQPLHTDLNEVEPRPAYNTQCQGLRADHKEDGEAAAAMIDDYKPSATDLTWDSHFFLDDMPSPQFSDSEKQFLLSALDSSYQASMLESHLLGNNMSMAPFCI